MGNMATISSIQFLVKYCFLLPSFLLKFVKSRQLHHVISGPMRGLEKNCTQWCKQMDGHGDSMTESAQWANLVKIYGLPNTLHIQYNSSLYFMKQEFQNLAYIYGDKMPSIMHSEIFCFLFCLFSINCIPVAARFYIVYKNFILRVKFLYLGTFTAITSVSDLSHF